MDWNGCISFSAKPGCHIKKLLRAAVLAATKDEEPPPVLELFWRCRCWGALPNAGGVNDQDYSTMYQMGIVSAVYDAAKARKEFKMTPDQERIILQLVKMGIT